MNKILVFGLIAGLVGGSGCSDTATPGSETSAFQLMGLYTDIVDWQSIDQAVPTEPGHAYATLGTLLTGASYDAAATAALALPAAARGAAFRYEDNRLAYVLWAVPAADVEDAQTTVTVPAGDASVLRVHAWDGLHTGASELISTTGGEASLDLVGTPQVFVQEP